VALDQAASGLLGRVSVRLDELAVIGADTLEGSLAGGQLRCGRACENRGNDSPFIGQPTLCQPACA
jgi:hypothetical protein